MQLGLDSFVAVRPDPLTGITPTPVERFQQLLEEITLADESGLDVFGIGEHHRHDFLDASSAVMLGYVADTTTQAADEFFPGYARAFTEIGRERGWPAVTRAHFDALRGPTGALLIGDPKTVAAKILAFSESLGGVDRVSFQMSVASLAHPLMLQAITLLGTQVRPLLPFDR